MKTGIFITARLGSTRLKKKHFLKVNGKPLLYYLIERIKVGFENELSNQKIAIVIVTSDEPINREFEIFSSSHIKVFYGSQNNIPLRHLQAAQFYNIDGIIAVDGDDILCSVMGMKAVYRSLKRGFNYVKTSGLPFGMNSLGYLLKCLKKSLETINNEILETGWGRIFNEKDLREVKFKDFGNFLNDLRFTLDYNEDYLFFKEVIEHFGNNIIFKTDKEIIEAVVNKKFYEINNAIQQKYWENFRKNMEMED